MKNNQIIGLLIASVAIVGAIIYLDQGKVRPAGSDSLAVPVSVSLPESTDDKMMDSGTSSMSKSETSSASMTSDRIAQKEKQFDRAKEIADPSGFVNTNDEPITLSQYVGKKVILLDIMTYSCINCIRTFPYLVDWYKKYEDKGLIIIGIHTPEFDFEKNIDNVKAAMKKYGIEFPVVLDNNYGTWNAYNNRYWPMKYLIDIDGFIRYTHIGEGGYDETEQQIQDLLKERADVLGLSSATKDSIDMPVSANVMNTPDQNVYGQSPETYLGSDRNEFFGNGTAGLPSDRASYIVPKNLSEDHFYLDGTWTITRDHAKNLAVPARIVYPFASKHVYIVASADNPVTLDIKIDSKAMIPVTIYESRLYEVYSGDSFGMHTIELSPETNGLKVFTFTFGN